MGNMGGEDDLPDLDGADEVRFKIIPNLYDFRSSDIKYILSIQIGPLLGCIPLTF